MLIEVAAGVAIATGCAGALRAVWKWRERRRYGPGDPVIDLSGKRVTWKRRTGHG
jgi:hypothetical protein